MASKGLKGALEQRVKWNFVFKNQSNVKKLLMDLLLKINSCCFTVHHKNRKSLNFLFLNTIHRWLNLQSARKKMFKVDIEEEKMRKSFWGEIMKVTLMRHKKIRHERVYYGWKQREERKENRNFSFWKMFWGRNY